MNDRKTRHILSFALRELRAMDDVQSWNPTVWLYQWRDLRSLSRDASPERHRFQCPGLSEFCNTRIPKREKQKCVGPSHCQISKKTLVFRCSVGLLFIFGTGVMLGRRRLSSAKTESSCLAAASFVAIAQAAPSAKPPFLTYNHERRGKMMANDGKWWQMMEKWGFESQKNVAEKLNNKFKHWPSQLSCDTQIRIIIQVACETEWTVPVPVPFR